MVKHHQTQAETGQGQQTEEPGHAPEPGFPGLSLETVAAVTVLGATPGEEPGLFLRFLRDKPVFAHRLLGDKAGRPRRGFFLHPRLASGGAARLCRRASSSSPVFQISPAPRVRTRSPALR